MPFPPLASGNMRCLGTHRWMARMTAGVVGFVVLTTVGCSDGGKGLSATDACHRVVAAQTSLSREVSFADDSVEHTGSKTKIRGTASPGNGHVLAYSCSVATQPMGVVQVSADVSTFPPQPVACSEASRLASLTGSSRDVRVSLRQDTDEETEVSLATAYTLSSASDAASAFAAGLYGLVAVDCNGRTFTIEVHESMTASQKDALLRELHGHPEVTGVDGL